MEYYGLLMRVTTQQQWLDDRCDNQSAGKFMPLNGDENPVEWQRICSW